MTIGDLVRTNAMYYPDQVAIQEGEKQFTWREVDLRTNQLAHGLLSLGLQKGDRLAILTPNTLHYWELFFGLAKSGVIGVPLNVRLHPQELIDYLNYTRPRALVVGAGMYEVARRIRAEVPTLEHVIGLPGCPEYAGYEELLAAHPTDPVPVEISEDDLYVFAATSGTTGTPKAAMHTHRGAVQAMHTYLAEGMDVRPRDCALQVIPMYFNPGGPASMFQFLKAAKGVILGEFSPEAFLKAVQEHRVTHTIVVPTMLSMIVNHPDVEKYDVSSIKMLHTGGSPVPASLLSRVREIFGDVVFPAYGLAESYSCGLILKREDQVTEGPERLTRRLNSAGKPHAGMQVRVVNEDGRDVSWGTGEAGEIIIKGATIAEGYWDMPEETAQTFRDGWLYTGDIGVIDEDGFIYVVDRKKDMIITGGINVFSVEVERVISAHPAVMMVAVIGVPDETWGEAIMACVVLKPGAIATEEEIINWCRERLASYKKPRYVKFVDSLPMSGTNKILKRELRKMFWAGREKAV